MNEPAPLTLALVGMGSAGRSRERACTEIEGIALAARVSRRPGAGDRPLSEVLQDPAVQALAISTENTAHADLVEAGLAAGKHVLCDYPLALSGTRARGLYELAKKAGRVLHVEHIALLSEEHRQLKLDLARVGRLVKGEYLFQGGWNDMLADTAYTGPYPFLAVSRLVQVADLFGPFAIASARAEAKPEGFSLHLHLRFPEGGILGFTEERLAGLPRRRSLVAECERGSVALKTGTMGGGLFARDLAWFRDRVREGRPCYYDEETMLGILDQLTDL